MNHGIPRPIPAVQALARSPASGESRGRSPQGRQPAAPRSGRRSSRLSLLVLASLLLGAAALAPSIGGSTLPPRRYVLHLDRELGDVLPLDVNGDGLMDLVVLEVDASRRDAPLHARVFLQSPDGFTPVGAGDILPEGVMLAGAGKFMQGPGLALLTDKGVAIWIWHGDRFAPQAMLPVEGLFPYPGGGLNTGLSWVADLNGDGLSELMVPRPDGLTLLRQNAQGDWVSAGLLRARARGQLFNMFRGKVAGYDLPAVSLVDPLPAPGQAPWRSVAVFNDGVLAVFRPDGEIVAGDRAPVLQQDLQPPVAFDPKVPYDPPLQLVAARDLDGDGLLDLVFMKAQSGESDFNARTRVLVYFGRPAASAGGFAFNSEPDQVYEEKGFTLPFVMDLNGDGRPDLVLVHVETGPWTVIKAFISRSVTADVGYYLMSNRRRYPVKPDATGKFSVNFSLGRAGHQPIVLFGDWNGDGFQDLLLSADKNRLGIHWGGAKGFWAEQPDATIQGPLPLRAERVRVGDLNGDGSDDLIFLYDRDDVRQMPETFRTVTVLLSPYESARSPAKAPAAGRRAAAQVPRASARPVSVVARASARRYLLVPRASARRYLLVPRASARNVPGAASPRQRVASAGQGR